MKRQIITTFMTFKTKKRNKVRTELVKQLFLGCLRMNLVVRYLQALNHTLPTNKQTNFSAFTFSEFPEVQSFKIKR